MRTVVTKNGLYVVGFSRPVIDPIATQKKVDSEIQKTDRYKRILKLIESFNKKPSDEILTEMVQLKRDIEDYRSRIWKDNIVLFEPKKGEYIISESKYKELSEKFKTLKNFEALTLDGEIEIDEQRKEQEKQSLLGAALNQSVLMRSQLEIKGEKAALEISQAHFEQLKQQIEKDYA